IVWRFVGPAAEALGLLCAVERAVDLNRANFPARISQLLRLRQTLGIKHSPPWLINPAANADTNHAQPLPAFLVGAVERFGQAFKRELVGGGSAAAGGALDHEVASLAHR